MKNILIILFSLIFFINTPIVFAHPGNTDSSGCHTCRTNCPSWGLYYGEYHCHTPKYTSPQIYTPPPSCPLNSYYDSGSDSCKCYSGYISNGSSCVSNQQYCWNKYGYSSTYDYATGNCKCSYGYVLSGGQCISGNTYCWNNYGYNSKYNSLTNNCECSYGYVWNNSGNRCVSQDESCHNQLGIMSKYNSLNNTCECFNGYTIQSGQCQIEQTETSPVIPYVPKSYSVMPTNTPAPTPTIFIEPTKQPSLKISPTTINKMTSSPTNTPIDLDKLITPTPTPKKNFLQWLLGFLIGK